ncbi:hypothetical protein SDC9_205163 [bioreactor metagenome]|uniref:Uncharacterized protein n=1 Tax=bioreactor metagenome TaxID=1076179 RepID=A0A645J447_9ZZZZ
MRCMVLSSDKRRTASHDSFKKHSRCVGKRNYKNDQHNKNSLPFIHFSITDLNIPAILYAEKSQY